MYPDIPYDGLSWPITQHAGVISADVLNGLLSACSTYSGKTIDDAEINADLARRGILTANIRADSEQADAWRDYQQILSELGLIFSTSISQELMLTPVAVAYIDGSITYEELLTLQLLRYQYPNGHKTQISPSLRDSFPAGTFNYKSVAHLQAMNGIRIRPAVVVWRVLYSLLEKGETPALTVDEMQSYVVRCLTNDDSDFCVHAIIDYRRLGKSLAKLPRARRNSQDWLKLLGHTPLFDYQHGQLFLSKYSIENASDIIQICETLSEPDSFWMPIGDDFKWDWFAIYGNINLGIDLIPDMTPVQEVSDSNTDEDNDIISPAKRRVELQPFSTIKSGKDYAKRKSVVSIYDYQKTQTGKKLHDSMVNLIAQKCISKGATVCADSKTIDLFARYQNREYLFEVKSITPSNFIARLRYAIGQVHQYNYLLPRQGQITRRLALAFTAEIPANSWTIPFVTTYLRMDLIMLKASALQVYSNDDTSNELFS